MREYERGIAVVPLSPIMCKLLWKMNIFLLRTQLDGSLLLSCFGVPFRTTFEEFDEFEEIDEAVLFVF